MSRRAVLCDGAELARLWGQIGTDENEILTWIPRAGESALRPARFHALAGGLADEEIGKLGSEHVACVALVSDDPAFLRAAISRVAEALPSASVLVLSDRVASDDLPKHPCLRHSELRTLIRDDLDVNFRHLGNLRRVVDIRQLLGSRDKIAILLQPDPDPDGIACGYALRSLIGRKSPTAPIVSFGEIKRPENRAMVAALGLEVKPVAVDDLEEFEGVALVDVQPTVFSSPLPDALRVVDVVIDHHPVRPGYGATLSDIRTSYGATSSILTEYLRAAEVDVGPRLATALLYGIKSDTQQLGRETSRADVDAFAFLHARHSPGLLRRIERPALPIPGLRALGAALAQTSVVDGLHVLALGQVREDVIAQVADMALQAEGADWAVAAGIVDGNLVFSVRNVGHVRAAGEVVRAVVEGLGTGGGHRSMAKGIIPLASFRAAFGRVDRATVTRTLQEAFARAIERKE